MVGPSNAEIDFLANSYISCGLFTVEYFILDSEEFSFEEPLYRDKICFVSCRERERERTVFRRNCGKGKRQFVK